MRNEYTLECCVDSVESALIAAAGGSDRLELCSNLVIGGTTPTLALYEAIRARSSIRIHALIRPRFGDFLYTEPEFDILCREVTQFRKAGAEGVVIGCLSADGTLNWNQMSRLVEAAGDMHITLHRAFDMCADPFAALEQAKALGIHTILTSGQKDSCIKGVSLLKELDQQAEGSIHIMAGAGVNADVISTLLHETNLHAFHMSGKKVINSRMTYRNSSVNMGIPGLSEYEIWQTDENAVQKANQVLTAYSI